MGYIFILFIVFAIIAIIPVKLMMIRLNRIDQYAFDNMSPEDQERQYLKKSLIDNFRPTKVIGNVSFDDKTQTFVIENPIFHKNLYYYDQIVDFELLENNSTIIKGGGIGRAVVGGLMFGTIGAIIGGATTSNKVENECSSLAIKIVLRNDIATNVYIPFIKENSSVDRNSSFYRMSLEKAHNTLSALQLAMESVNSFDDEEVTITSSADEILKYKKLLDAGVITAEEFNAKKAQLLKSWR